MIGSASRGFRWFFSILKVVSLRMIYKVENYIFNEKINFNYQNNNQNSPSTFWLSRSLLCIMIRIGCCEQQIFVKTKIKCCVTVIKQTSENRININFSATIYYISRVRSIVRLISSARVAALTSTIVCVSWEGLKLHF